MSAQNRRSNSLDSVLSCRILLSTLLTAVQPPSSCPPHNRPNSDKMLHNTDDALFRQMLEVHTVAPFRIVRAAAPYLRVKDESQQENRSIVNVSLRATSYHSVLSGLG